jgi:hypothetical protein
MSRAPKNAWTKYILIGLMLAAPGVPAIAGTNLPALADYPAPNCVRPGDKPVLARDAPRVVSAGGMSINTGTRDVKEYNKQISRYNAALQDYTACMNAYVANGQADMDAIRTKVNQSVEQGRIP